MAALALLHSAERLRRAYPDALYTVSPIPGKGGFRVRLELSGLRPGRIPLEPPAGGPVFGDALPGGEADAGVVTPPVWWASVNESGDLDYLYEVTPDERGESHALFFGSRLFAVPLLPEPARPPALARAPGGAWRRAARIEVRFLLPEGWEAHTPWGETRDGIATPGGDLALLRESVVALGDFTERRFRQGGTRVLLAVRGADAAGEAVLEDLIRDCLAAHEAQLGPLPYRRVLIAVSHPFSGEQAMGRATGNAAALRLSHDPGAHGWRSTGRVVAHEVFHFWNGGALALPLPAERWFLEGASDYYALQALAASGRLAPGELADELAATLDRLEGNAWADSALGAIGAAAEQDGGAWVATYAKGALAAWALDLRLGAKGGLDGILRELLASREPPSVEARLRAVRGAGAAELLDSLSGPGFRAALAGELGASGLRIEREPSGLLTLGLRSFVPGTTQVLELDPRSPAFRGGLRPGDRIVSVDSIAVRDLGELSAALAEARPSGAWLGAERGGRALRFLVVPASAYRRRAVPVVEPRVMATTEPPPGGAAR